MKRLSPALLLALLTLLAYAQVGAYSLGNGLQASLTARGAISVRDAAGGYVIYYSGLYLWGPQGAWDPSCTYQDNWFAERYESSRSRFYSKGSFSCGFAKCSYEVSYEVGKRGLVGNITLQSLAASKFSTLSWEMVLPLEAYSAKNVTLYNGTAVEVQLRRGHVRGQPQLGSAWGGYAWIIPAGEGWLVVFAVSQAAPYVRPRGEALDGREWNSSSYVLRLIQVEDLDLPEKFYYQTLVTIILCDSRENLDKALATISEAYGAAIRGDLAEAKGILYDLVEAYPESIIDPAIAAFALLLAAISAVIGFSLLRARRKAK